MTRSVVTPAMTTAPTASGTKASGIITSDANGG